MKIGLKYGLVAEDIVSTGMGQQGVDIQLSPAAKKVFPLSIEAKRVESLNVSTTFFKHYDKYKTLPTSKILVHAKNRTPALVTLLWDDYLGLLEASITLKESQQQNVPEAT